MKEVPATGEGEHSALTEETLTPTAALARFVSQKGRVQHKIRAVDEPAFVIATYAWSESSLIAELFTEHYGRVPVVVKGAKRAYSKFRGLINAFVPLLVNFSGAGDVKNLTDAKWLGSLSPIDPANLMSAFYVNELVLRLTVREDPAPGLFSLYTEVLSELSHQKGQALQLALRRFEVGLLENLGWGQTAKGEITRIEETAWCVRDGELMPSARAIADTLTTQPAEMAVSCRCARAIIENRIEDPDLLPELRRVLRSIIGYYVGDRGLNTRKTLSRWSQI